MYPAPFRYHRPDTLQAAIKLLGRYGDQAKLLAGGQSLIPMMKLRMGEMSELIDISRLPDVSSSIDERDGALHIGALATHAGIADSEAAARIPARKTGPGRSTSARTSRGPRCWVGSC